MGCDIHGVLQTRYKTDSGEPNEWYNACEIERGRNYTLFSILADVRNGIEGQPGYIPPIAQPRGWPDDFKLEKVIQPKYPEEGEDDGVYVDYGRGSVTFCIGDDHSNSWLTIEELRAYAWDAKVSRSGIVRREQWEAYVKDGTKPEWWCGGTSGVVISESDAAVRAETDDPTPFDYVDMSWEDDWSYADCCGAFLKWLDYVTYNYNPKVQEARIVFCFDN